MNMNGSVSNDSSTWSLATQKSLLLVLIFYTSHRNNIIVDTFHFSSRINSEFREWLLRIVKNLKYLFKYLYFNKVCNQFQIIFPSILHRKEHISYISVLYGDVCFKYCAVMNCMSSYCNEYGINIFLVIRRQTMCI